MSDENAGSASGYPRSADGLDVNEVDDGLVIYDGQSDRVHYLNMTAGVVFSLCDGEHSESQVVALTRETFDGEDLSDTDVAACLAQLRTEGIVV